MRAGGGRRLLAVVLAGGVAAVVGPAAGIPSPPRPAAAATNRVALIVQVDANTTKRVCLTFSEPSLTGRQVLERAAGIDPVFADFGGQGSAVCALCGKGCPPDSTCLTCQEPNYWAYHRAAAGSSGFSYSNAGPGRTEVRNGDVEGWRWGTGAAPPFATFATICDGAPAATTTSTTRSTPPTTKASSPTTAPPSGSGPSPTTPTGGAPSGSSGSAGAPAPTNGAGRRGTTSTTGPLPPGATATTVAADGSDPTVPTAGAEGTTTSAPDRLESAAPDGSPASSSSPLPGLLAVGAALVGIGAWTVRTRRRRT